MFVIKTRLIEYVYASALMYEASLLQIGGASVSVLKFSSSIHSTSVINLPTCGKEVVWADCPVTFIWKRRSCGPTVLWLWQCVNDMAINLEDRPWVVFYQYTGICLEEASPRLQFTLVMSIWRSVIEITVYTGIWIICLEATSCTGDDHSYYNILGKDRYTASGRDCQLNRWGSSFKFQCGSTVEVCSSLVIKVSRLIMPIMSVTLTWAFWYAFLTSLHTCRRQSRHSSSPLCKGTFCRWQKLYQWWKTSFALRYHW